MKNRIAIVDGIRTPQCKAGGIFKDISADDLGAYCVKELLTKLNLPVNEIDELIFGNVSQPMNKANIARVIALKSGLPNSIPAYTVHRNCASGAESVTTAAAKINAGEANIFVTGGTESMSNIPLMFSKKMEVFFAKLMRSKSIGQKLNTLLSFRPKDLQPVIGIVEGLTDPICGLIMGKTAEVLAREFQINRAEQDDFALLSHKRAVNAQEAEVFDKEILPLPMPPAYKSIQSADDGPRKDQSLHALKKLRPYFDRHNGTVTVGNSCPLSDGAAALVVMSEENARNLGYDPLGYLIDYAYAGLEPNRMGLGPVYATAKLLKNSKINFNDIDLIELNEAFAAQVIANERAFASNDFAQTYLGRSQKIGDIDRNKLNVNGGAIALGHPVGTTGARLILTLLKELRRQNKQLGLATMCIGGGQGGAMLVEVDS